MTDQREPGGRTDIADRVLERIASHALSEVGQVGGVARRVLGVPLGQDSPDASPRVEAHVDGGVAMLKMTVSVVYPAPVRGTVRQVREHVGGRVSHLTGLDVRQVDVDVARLVTPQDRGRRVE